MKQCSSILLQIKIYYLIKLNVLDSIYIKQLEFDSQLTSPIIKSLSSNIQLMFITHIGLRYDPDDVIDLNKFDENSFPSNISLEIRNKKNSHLKLFSNILPFIGWLSLKSANSLSNLTLISVNVGLSLGTVLQQDNINWYLIRIGTNE